MKFGKLSLISALLVMFLLVGACESDDTPTGTTSTNDMPEVEQPSEPPAPEEPIVDETEKPAAAPEEPTDNTNSETALELLPIYDPELDALFSQVEDRTRKLRGLEAPIEPIYELVPIEEYRENSAEEAIRGYRDSHRETVYKLLGTLNADVDFVSLLAPTSSVLRVSGGRYDGDMIRILYDEDDFDDSRRLDQFLSIYAHEYTHYLQDRHFNTFPDWLATPSSSSENRLSAFVSLVEGEASLVQTLYHNVYRENYALVPEVPTLASGVTTSFDNPLRGFLLNYGFPYTYGANFVARFVPELEKYDFPTAISSITDTRFISDDIFNEGQAISVPRSETYNFTAVDDLYSNPPVSTEQILHPELYPDHMPIEIPDVLLSIPGGWYPANTAYNPQLHGAYGEFFIRAWLETLKVDVELAYNAAAGWGNDHFRLLRSEDGEFAILWIIIWDDPKADSAELADALTDTITKQHDITASSVVRDPTIKSNTCGADRNISWSADTGVLVHRIQDDPTVGAVTRIAIAPSCEAALELLSEGDG